MFKMPSRKYLEDHGPDAAPAQTLFVAGREYPTVAFERRRDRKTAEARRVHDADPTPRSGIPDLRRGLRSVSVASLRETFHEASKWGRPPSERRAAPLGARAITPPPAA